MEEVDGDEPAVLGFVCVAIEVVGDRDFGDGEVES